MTQQHKNALAQGRDEGRAVRRYLEALEASRPKRGRKRTPEAIQKRLAQIDDRVAGADALRRLQLVQERMDLERELESREQTTDLAGLETDFVKVAKGYGERKRISYAAWRQAGVDAAVLKRAGISRATP